MNDDDLRNCFAMFTLAGTIMRGELWTPKQVWDVADDMVEARNKEDNIGLPPIKTRKAKKND
jgi:negative regulator of sigma E activity